MDTRGFSTLSPEEKKNLEKSLRMSLCRRRIRIVSEQLGAGLLPDGHMDRYYDVLVFSGCYSLGSFVRHLERAGCTDYDVDMVKRIMESDEIKNCDHKNTPTEYEKETMEFLEKAFGS